VHRLAHVPVEGGRDPVRPADVLQEGQREAAAQVVVHASVLSALPSSQASAPLRTPSPHRGP
jgi:hypothetical protein